LLVPEDWPHGFMAITGLCAKALLFYTERRVMTLAINDPDFNYRSYEPDHLQYRSVVDPLRGPVPFDGAASVSIFDER
jgi:hypothetical protein